MLNGIICNVQPRRNTYTNTCIANDYNVLIRRMQYSQKRDFKLDIISFKILKLTVLISLSMTVTG